MGVDRLKLHRSWRQAMFTQLLAGQRADGGFGVHPSSKWTGSHWRLVSLIELGSGWMGPGRRAAALAMLQ